MKVECSSLTEFLENLPPDVDVYGGVIYVSVNRSPMGEYGTSMDRRKALKFRVTFQASAVVVRRLGECEEQHLLQSGEDCGFDYEDGSKELLGSDEVKRLRGQLEAVCKARGWVVRPGIVSE